MDNHCSETAKLGAVTLHRHRMNIIIYPMAAIQTIINTAFANVTATSLVADGRTLTLSYDHKGSNVTGSVTGKVHAIQVTFYVVKKPVFRFLSLDEYSSDSKLKVLFTFCYLLFSIAVV
jgi:hypothetical protein